MEEEAVEEVNTKNLRFDNILTSMGLNSDALDNLEDFSDDGDIFCLILWVVGAVSLTEWVLIWIYKKLLYNS